MRKSTLSWIGNFEEKIDLSHIYLAVQTAFSFDKKILGAKNAKQCLPRLRFKTQPPVLEDS